MSGGRVTFSLSPSGSNRHDLSSERSYLEYEEQTKESPLEERDREQMRNSDPCERELIKYRPISIEEIFKLISSSNKSKNIFTL